MELLTEVNRSDSVKTVRTALFFLLIWVPPLMAEDAAYVSRLTVQASSQSVLLTWKDADGYSGAAGPDANGEAICESLSALYRR